MKEKDDTTRFTLHGSEDEPESMYMAEAENLRIEKLSTRVTLVAVLIPCLLAIVLAIAYLDIKKRVIRTQNTGSMGVQSLSKDLESRFSTLSLKQAKIDEQFADQAKKLDNTTAAIHVKLQKATDSLQKAVDKKTDNAALTTISKETESSITALKKEMGALRQEVKALGVAFNKFDDELAGQILLMAEGLKEEQVRLSNIEKRTQQLETEKLSKEAMNLAIGLERLALQEMINERIGSVEKKVAALGKKVEKIDRNFSAGTSSATPTPPTAPPKPADAAEPTVPSDSSGIIEQTIK